MNKNIFQGILYLVFVILNKYYGDGELYFPVILGFYYLILKEK